MRILMMLSLWLCCMVGEAQQKTPAQKPKKPMRDFAYLMQYADNLFKNGEYIKASRLYDICANMPEEEPLKARKKRDKCLELNRMREEAFNQFTKKNFKAAIVLYDKILTKSENPTDPIAAKYKKSIIEIQNTPLVIDLEILLKKADDMLSKGRLSDARILFQIVISAPENYKKTYVQAKIQEIDAINTALKEYQRLAYINPKKAKEILNKLSNQYGKDWTLIKKVEDEVENNLRRHNELMAIAKKRFRAADYAGALNKYTQATQIKGFTNIKIAKQKILDCENIIIKKQEIARLIIDPDKNNIVESNFKFILQKNPDDIPTRNEYYEFIKTMLVTAYKNNDCEKIKTTIVKLNFIDKNKGTTSNINQYVDRCDNNEKCFIRKSTFTINLKEATKNLFNARTTEDLSNVNQLLNQLKTECETYHECLSDSLCRVLSDTIRYTQKKIQRQKCMLESDNLLAISDSLFTINLCKEATATLKQIDTTCLVGNGLKLYRNTLARANSCFKKQMYNAFMDSTNKQIEKNYRIDAKRLLDSAMVYAPDSISFRRAYCQKNPELCKEIKNTDKTTKPCTDTTLKAKKTEFVIGANYLSFLSEVAINPMGTRFVFPNLVGSYYGGIRRNFIHYKKPFDFLIGLNFHSINTEVLQTQLFDQTISGSLKIQMVESTQEIKWHTIPDCPTKLRLFLTTGVSEGYSWSNAIAEELVFTKEFKNTTNQPIVGFLVSTGIDLPKSKKFGGEIAIFYSQKAGVYEHTSKKILNPFQTKTYYTMFGLRLSLRFW